MIVLYFRLFRMKSAKRGYKNFMIHCMCQNNCDLNGTLCPFWCQTGEWISLPEKSLRTKDPNMQTLLPSRTYWTTPIFMVMGRRIRMVLLPLKTLGAWQIYDRYTFLPCALICNVTYSVEANNREQKSSSRPLFLCRAYLRGDANFSLSAITITNWL